MRCDKCKIEVNNLSDNCPLCGKYLTECIGDLQPNYPNLEKSSLNKPHNKLLRLMLFLIIAISIITLTVNLLTSPQYLWSIIPVSAMWLVLPVLGVPFAKKKLTPLMLVLDN
ncbi:MAG: DUF6320 domain-containing protein, partial [Bacillota bacterium]|nr:DUF6320 domain-containing protein [Bacillota bacterium]